MYPQASPEVTHIHNWTPGSKQVSLPGSTGPEELHFLNQTYSLGGVNAQNIVLKWVFSIKKRVETL